MDSIKNLRTAVETIEAIEKCAKIGDTGPTQIGKLLGLSRGAAQQRVRGLRVHRLVEPDEYNIMRVTEAGRAAVRALAAGGAQ